MTGILGKTKNALNYIENSFYYKKIKNNKNIIIVSLILAIVCTLISYPGIWYSDSYSRVQFADNVIESCNAIFEENRNPIELTSWLTVVPSFFMGMCKVATGNIALYTVLQSFMFFLVTFLLIKKMKTFLYKFQYVLFALSPLIFCVSVYYEAGIGCVTGIVALLLLLDDVKIEKYKLDRFIEFILLLLFSFVIFGYRANAFTIIPVLLIYVFKLKIEAKRKIFITSALILGIVSLSIVNHILNIRLKSSGSAGFVWEIIRIIQEMEPEKKEKYEDYLDEICGEGGTKIELDATDEISVNGFLSSENGITTYNLSEKGNSKKILKKYINIILNEPKLYFKVKLDFTQKTLGICEPIAYKEFNYDRFHMMKNYNFSDSSRRQEFVNVYEKVNNIFGFFIRRPWLVFLLSTLLVTIKWRQKDEKTRFYILLLMVSIFYYGAFIINTQSFEVRYFYPSLYLCMILDVAIAMDFIRDIFIKRHISKFSKKITI